MRYVLIANPEAGSSTELPSLLDSARESMSLPVWRTEGPGHARELARKAVLEGFDGIVAAGGDGTIHEIVNGIAPDFDGCRLALIPLGTGNDLCRFLGASLDAERLVSALESNIDRKIDLIEVRLENGELLHAVNAISAGFGGKVAESVSTELKSKYGPFAFLIGAQQALSELEIYEASLVLDGRQRVEEAILGIVLANGSTVAGGLEVAPGASAEDGLLDVLIFRDRGALELASLAAHFAAGDVLGSESVELHAVTRLTVTSDPPMPYSVDGELQESPAREIELLPKRLRIAVPAPEEAERR